MFTITSCLVFLQTQKKTICTNVRQSFEFNIDQTITEKFMY